MKTTKNESKTIVRTFYGKGDMVTDFFVNLFDEETAKRYCQNTNGLRLKGDK